MVVLLPIVFSFLITVSVQKVAEVLGSRKAMVIMNRLPFVILTCTGTNANVQFESVT